jgi:hypothetical protein
MCQQKLGNYEQAITRLKELRQAIDSEEHEQADYEDRQHVQETQKLLQEAEKLILA